MAHPLYFATRGYTFDNTALKKETAGQTVELAGSKNIRLYVFATENS